MSDYPENGEWRLTPRWHWRYWFGWDIRLPVYDSALTWGEQFWVYGRSRVVAHELLRREYEPVDEFCDAPGHYETPPIPFHHPRNRKARL